MGGKLPRHIILDQCDRGINRQGGGLQRLTDIEPVDHGRSAIGDPARFGRATQRLQPRHQVGMQPPRIKRQEPAHLLRPLRLGIEGKPCSNDLTVELVGLERDADDRGNPFAGRRRGRKGGPSIGAQLPQQRADRLDQQPVLGTEVMMRERWRDTRLAGDLRHGDGQRTMMADRLQRGINKRLPAHGLHSNLRHASSPILTHDNFD